jgi:hypothetical protein
MVFLFWEARVCVLCVQHGADRHRNQGQCDQDVLPRKRQEADQVDWEFFQG